MDGHVALGLRGSEALQRGCFGRGVAFLHGPLGEAHVHLQVGQEPVGGVDGRQEEVLVAPASAWREKCGHRGQSQQEGRGAVQHGTRRVSPARMVLRRTSDGRQEGQRAETPDACDFFLNKRSSQRRNSFTTNPSNSRHMRASFLPAYIFFLCLAFQTQLCAL